MRGSALADGCLSFLVKEWLWSDGDIEEGRRKRVEIQKSQGQEFGWHFFGAIADQPLTSLKLCANFF